MYNPKYSLRRKLIITLCKTKKWKFSVTNKVLAQLHVSEQIKNQHIIIIIIII